MLIAIIGNIGSGKTLLMRILMMFCSRKVLANFLVKKFNGYKRLELIDLIDLPDNRDLFIDEAYVWLESRTSMSKINRFISYLILQSRKRTIDIYVAVQLFSTIDLRFRQNADIIIMCECIKKRGIIQYFEYKFYKVDKGSLKLFKLLQLTYQNAVKFFDLYDTYEIIPSKDYQNLILDILADDISRLKVEMDKRIRVLLKVMKESNAKYTIKNIKGYMGICNIPMKFQVYVESALREMGYLQK